MAYANYKKVHPRSEYVQPIVPSKTIDPTVATWAGIWSQQANTFVTPLKKVLDPRLVQSVSDPSATVQSILISTEVTWAPAFNQLAGSYRTPPSKSLDVRLTQWENNPSWFQSALGGGVTPGSTLDSPTIYKRRYPRTDVAQDVSWVPFILTPQQGPTVSQYIPPVTSPYSSYVTPQGVVKDPRYDFYDRTFGIPFDPALLVGPYSSYQSYRTPSGSTMDVRRHTWVQDTSYVAKLQFPTTASFYPAWAELQQSYRTPDRPVMDVRRHQWDVGTTWINSQAAIPVPSWNPAFIQLQNAYRTPQGKALDPRLATWGTGDGGWITFIVNNPPPPPPGVFITMSDGIASCSSYHT